MSLTVLLPSSQINAPLAAVVLHPHPQYGGDMDSHVVTTACRVYADRGATTMRFNFRGTDRSEGAYAGGVGEAEDARSAIAAVREIIGDAPVVLIGYSFGAMVASAVARDTMVDGLVLISPPVAAGPVPVIPLGLRTLIITGEEDDIAPCGSLKGFGTDSCCVICVPGASHAWWPGIDVLATTLAEFAQAT